MKCDFQKEEVKHCLKELLLWLDDLRKYQEEINDRDNTLFSGLYCLW